MRNVFITGPTGAVGRALTVLLFSENADITLIVRRDSERTRNIPDLPGINVIKRDLDELRDLAIVKAGSSSKEGCFIHLGWEGTTGSGRNDPELQSRNVEHTLDAVRLADRLGCGTFLFAGSQAECGNADGCITPGTPANPLNEYGRAKNEAGEKAAVLCRDLNIRFIRVRILSVYGPGDGEGSMITSSIRRMISGERVSLTEGRQLWDYIYSMDAARAMLLCAEKGEEGVIYPIGSGKARPLRSYIEEMAEAIFQITGREPGEIGFGDIPYQEGQLMHLEADINKLSEDTGFVPEVSFREGIRETINYIYRS